MKRTLPLILAIILLLSACDKEKSVEPSPVGLGRLSKKSNGSDDGRGDSVKGGRRAPAFAFNNTPQRHDTSDITDSLVSSSL